jgi:hypothetical protein
MVSIYRLHEHSLRLIDVGDPVLDCTYSTDEGCDASWALILDSSKNVTIAGSGLYSWFQSYTQDCVANQNCQRAVVSISSNMNSSGIYLFNIITIGSVSMISSPADELSIEIFAGVNTNTNVNPWWSLVTAYLAPDLGTFYRNNHNYYGLGDSFSAGIGAGATYSPDCMFDRSLLTSLPSTPFPKSPKPLLKNHYIEY